MACFEYGEKEIAWLKARDKRLGAAIEKLGHLRRPITPDLFTALIRFVIEQQISVAAAKTVNARLLALCEGNIRAGTILRAGAQAIQACGTSMRKAQYIIGIAEAVHAGNLDLSGIPAMSDQEVITALTSLKGIGVWTAEMLLIMSLERPDILSWGDLAIQRGMMNLYGHRILTREQFERYRRRYSPYGTTASLYLWALSK